MKYYGLVLFTVFCVFAGCENPQPLPPKPPIEGIKINDLKGNITSISTDSLMKFRILTYAVDPDSVENLKKIVDSLSLEDVRIVNKGAFQENGFAIGTSSRKEGNRVVQQLSQAGAVQIGQSALMFPPDNIEDFTQIFLQGGEIIKYAKSADKLAILTFERCFLGWICSAKPDPRFRETAQIKLCPASWKPGGESIRLAMGKEAIDYQPIREGQVLARIEVGGFILLCPGRSVPEDTTLDKMLFFLPGQKPKVQCFIIICDSAGN